MRGKRHWRSQYPCASGFIPARAGETFEAPPLGPIRAVHPRSCGGNVGIGEEIDLNRGSSPLVRGKRRRMASTRNSGRFIPARAGETARTNLFYHPHKVHPRSCGGNSTDKRLAMPPSGSSPLVRGKPRPRSYEARSRRFIPARAGETLQCALVTYRETVHPRSCGGNWRLGTYPCHDIGSSPLVRGKQASQGGGICTERFIPARAGETRSIASATSFMRVHPRSCGGNSIVSIIGRQ